MTAALEVFSLVLVGSIAGAELGSWCCVQPVISRLTYEQYVALEQAMLRTFGRIMPVMMPLSGVLAMALLVASRRESGLVLWVRVAAAMCIAVTVITTLTVNVPINKRTATWQLTENELDWRRMRRRWHLFQGVRGWLFMCTLVAARDCSRCRSRLIAAFCHG